MLDELPYRGAIPRLLGFLRLRGFLRLLGLPHFLGLPWLLGLPCLLGILRLLGSPFLRRFAGLRHWLSPSPAADLYWLLDT